MLVCISHLDHLPGTARSFHLSFANMQLAQFGQSEFMFSFSSISSVVPVRACCQVRHGFDFSAGSIKIPPSSGAFNRIPTRSPFDCFTTLFSTADFVHFFEVFFSVSLSVFFCSAVVTGLADRQWINERLISLRKRTILLNLAVWEMSQKFGSGANK